MSTEAKPKTGIERVAEGVVKESDVVTVRKEGEGGEEVAEVRKGRGRRRRRPNAETKEGMSTTARTMRAEPIQRQDIKYLADMLVRYERLLNRIEDRLKPIKRIEKESTMIDTLKRQIKDLSKQVSKLEKSINKLKASGKGRRGKVRGRKTE
ncbi:MAG: hypothetical protein QW178_03140 [Candidatus Nitrosocaldus sp.]